MLHRFSFKHHDCYFVQRAWGNLLVYPFLQLSPNDNQYFISKGGIYRQLVFGKEEINPAQASLFSKFGAALVVNEDFEYHPNIKIEKNAEEFYDPDVIYYQDDSFQVIRIKLKESNMFFLDYNFKMINSKIVVLDSNKSFRAKNFIRKMRTNKGDSIICPSAKGANIFKCT
jgi:hypothetical protein